MSAIEEQAKQVANTLDGLAPRLGNIMTELPDDTKPYWRQKFSGVLGGLDVLVNPEGETDSKSQPSGTKDKVAA